MGANETSFKPGRKKTGGRKAGVRNKNPALLAVAAMAAMGKIGSNGAGRDGMVGYLAKIAEDQPAAFSKLLCRILTIEMAYEYKRQPLSTFTDEELFDEIRKRDLQVDDFSASPTTKLWQSAPKTSRSKRAN